MPLGVASHFFTMAFLSEAVMGFEGEVLVVSFLLSQFEMTSPTATSSIVTHVQWIFFMIFLAILDFVIQC
jgi:hypothetical protein